jgi:hypothetical protein
MTRQKLRIKRVYTPPDDEHGVRVLGETHNNAVALKEGSAGERATRLSDLPTKRATGHLASVEIGRPLFPARDRYIFWLDMDQILVRIYSSPG